MSVERIAALLEVETAIMKAIDALGRRDAEALRKALAEVRAIRERLVERGNIARDPGNKPH